MSDLYDTYVAALTEGVPALCEVCRISPKVVIWDARAVGHQCARRYAHRMHWGIKIENERRGSVGTVAGCTWPDNFLFSCIFRQPGPLTYE